MELEIGALTGAPYCERAPNGSRGATATVIATGRRGPGRSSSASPGSARAAIFRASWSRSGDRPDASGALATSVTKRLSRNCTGDKLTATRISLTRCAASAQARVERPVAHGDNEARLFGERDKFDWWRAPDRRSAAAAARQDFRPSSTQIRPTFIQAVPQIVAFRVDAGSPHVGIEFEINVRIESSSGKRKIS